MSERKRERKAEVLVILIVRLIELLEIRFDDDLRL